MIAVLEKTAIRERAVPISRAAYHLMFENGLIAEKTELIEGVVVEKMPKSALHVFIVNEIYRLMTRLLPESHRVRQEQPLAIGGSEPEPDIAVVRADRAGDLKEHPVTAELVLEISNSTLALDRDKAEIYAHAAIPRYLVVNLVDRQVEEYTRPDAAAYRDSKIMPFGKLTLWTGIDYDLSRF